MSESVAKALRGGIGREGKRGISTLLFACPGSIRAFATDLDNLRRHGPSRRAAAGRTATMAGTPAISRTAAPIHRASVSRAGGPLDAKDPAGIATTPRDAPRGPARAERCGPGPSRLPGRGGPGPGRRDLRRGGTSSDRAHPAGPTRSRPRRGLERRRSPPGVVRVILRPRPGQERHRIVTLLS